MSETFFDPPPPRFNLDEDNDIQQFPCTYRSPNDFKTIATDYKSEAMSMLMYNVRSCRKNFSTFVTFLCSLMVRFSFIVLVETWLTEDIDHAFDISGYKQANVYRDKFGGGIKFFYNEMLDIEVIDSLSFVNDVMEVLTLFLIGQNFKYIVCSVYRSPSADPVLFNELFFSEVIDRFPANTKVIITGDFNLNLFNPIKSVHIDAFIANMLGFGFFPVITIPAKLNENSVNTTYSLIDQIWVNFSSGTNHDSGVLVFPLTDHFPIHYRFKNSCHGILRTIVSRVINDDNIATFINLMSDADFRHVFQNQQLNHAFDQFYFKLLKIYNSAFPIK